MFRLKTHTTTTDVIAPTIAAAAADADNTLPWQRRRRIITVAAPRASLDLISIGKSLSGDGRGVERLSNQQTACRMWKSPPGPAVERIRSDSYHPYIGGPSFIWINVSGLPRITLPKYLVNSFYIGARLRRPNGSAADAPPPAGEFYGACAATT